VNRDMSFLGRLSVVVMLAAVTCSKIAAQVRKDLPNCDRRPAASWITSFSPTQYGGGLSLGHFAYHSVSGGIIVYFTHGTNEARAQVFLGPNKEQPAGCRAILKPAVCTANCGA
jgi:hypothetical protein